MFIAILAATYLYKRGFTSIDKIKALLNKTKKSARDYLAKIDTNPDVYILETIQSFS